MNLDLAIQNQVIGRSFMADAMHGVASSLGDGHYRLNAFYESEDEAKAILGEPLASYIPNPVSAYVRPPTAPPNYQTPIPLIKKLVKAILSPMTNPQRLGR